MVILAIHSGTQLGGSTLNLGFIVKSLIRRSHRVYALNRYQEDEGSRYLEQCGAQLVYFRWFSLRMNTTTILESSQSPLAREIVTTIYDIAKWFTGLYLTVKYIRKFRPDILFVTESALPQCVVAARLFQIPVVCELQAELIKGRFGFRRAFYIGLLKRSDRIFGITRFHVEPFQTSSIGDGSVRVIPNTVDREVVESVSEFDLRATYGIRAKKKIASYFGGASPIKGCRFLLSLMKQVLTARDDVVFVLAGPFHLSFRSEWGVGNTKNDRDETKYIFEFVNANALGENIRIVGEVSNAVAIMKQSDVVVSSNSFPHFSRTIIEAFHSRVPVLASNDKFSREVIEDGVNGMLADFENSDEWVRKLNQILDNPRHARQMAEEGHQVYASAFSPSMVSAQILETFENLWAERCQ